MGYRSDVTVIMYADTLEEQVMVNEWVKVQLAKRVDDLKDSFSFLPNMVRFEVNGWKWYDSYEEIQWLEKLFEDYVDTFCGENKEEAIKNIESGSSYAIEYARVGENYEDIVTWEKGYAEGRLYVARSIIVD